MFKPFQARPRTVSAVFLTTNNSNKKEVYDHLLNSGVDVVSYKDCLAIRNKKAAVSFAYPGNYIVEEEPGQFIVYTCNKFNETYVVP